MVLVIDNFDSFTYNLVQGLMVAGAEVQTVRNDAISLEEIISLQTTGIVLAPGPGTPESSGVCLAVASSALRGELDVPVLGVCLGHQVLANQAGAIVGEAREVRHGKPSVISHDSQGVFCGLPSPLSVIRYHSLSVLAPPMDFVVSARAQDDGEIMGLRHDSLPIESVQFHPESILTEYGQEMLARWHLNSSALMEC